MTQRNGLHQGSPGSTTLRRGPSSTSASRSKSAGAPDPSPLPGLLNGRRDRTAPDGEGRLRDCVLAALLLVLTAPLIMVGAALIKLTSRGPVIYCQTRVGRHGRNFMLYKLRTMIHNCEATTGARWCSGRNDPRVTWVGRLLRRTHVDELPQFWHVLRGDMGLIGPRPERPKFVAELELAIHRYAERLAVRPGVTGLAQILLPPDTSVECVRRKLRYDLYYLKHRGLGLDLRILLGTLVHVLGLSPAISQRLLGIPGATVIEAHPENVAVATAVS